MRSVGQEAPQAVLARLPLGEGALQPVEHRVERDPEPADLGARVDGLDAVREIAAGDRAGRVADPVERQQTDPYDRPGDEASATSTPRMTSDSIASSRFSVASISVSGAATTVTPVPNRSGSA